MSHIERYSELNKTMMKPSKVLSMICLVVQGAGNMDDACKECLNLSINEVSLGKSSDISNY